MPMANTQDANAQQSLDTWAYEYAMMLYSQYKHDRENGTIAFTSVE